MVGLTPLSSMSIFRFFTTPSKWWFFGSVVAVFAVAIHAQQWGRRFQVAFAILAVTSSIAFLSHTRRDSNFPWKDRDYAAAESSSQAIASLLPNNSRVFTVIDERSSSPPALERTEAPEPSGLLLLNTWIAYTHLILGSWGYESLQPEEAKHYMTAHAFNPASLKDVGVSAVWVDSRAFDPHDFSPDFYEQVLHTKNQFLMRLKDPGQVVTCENECDANLKILSDGIEINFLTPVSGDVNVKINALKNFVVQTDQSEVSVKESQDGWLHFTANGQRVYMIKYKDEIYLMLLAASLVYATLLLVWIFLREDAV
jgi:hypothetical protein